MQELIDRMFQASARIGGMWPFPMHEPSDAYLEAFEYRDEDKDFPTEISDLCKSWDEDECAELFDGDSLSGREAHSELASEAHLKGLSGFVGVIEYPIFTASSSGGASFSWGHYRSELIFAPTADALIVKACERAEAAFQKAIAPTEPEQVQP